MQEARLPLEATLRELESTLNGRACGLSGRCPYCTEPCARVDGLPCRHPELARPSLEALGYDVGALSEVFMNTPIKWAKEGRHPEYYTLLGGVFYTERKYD